MRQPAPKCLHLIVQFALTARLETGCKGACMPASTSAYWACLLSLSAANSTVWQNSSLIYSQGELVLITVGTRTREKFQRSTFNCLAESVTDHKSG